MYSLATILLIGSAAALRLTENETVDMAQVNATEECHKEGDNWVGCEHEADQCPSCSTHWGDIVCN